MAEGRLSGMTWREWSSEPQSSVSPAMSKVTAATMSAHADLGPSPALRIGTGRIPVLGRARMYVCGITPYETTHVGHAATFVWADVAARALRLAGAVVDVCRNVTDIDDHLLAQAQRDGVSWRSLAAQETYRFEHDMAALGVVRPAFEPRSREYVDEVVALALELLAAGRAYTRNGSVYFRGEGVAEAAGLDRAEAIRFARERGSAGRRSPRRRSAKSAAGAQLRTPPSCSPTGDTSTSRLTRDRPRTSRVGRRGHLR